MKKFGLRLTGRRKWYFLIFAFSLYPNFKLLLSKILKWILRVLSNFYYVTNTLDVHICNNETATILIFFEICTDMHFVSLFFRNKSNITTSLLMIHLKYTVVHYADLNSSSRNQPFLNYGSLNMLFRFFSISYLCLF